MNKPVSFELAKLLKEKGFEIFTAFEYTDSGKLVERRNCAQNRLCSAPTIAEVVMWLYDKHGIWVDVSLNQFSKPKDLQWMYSILFTEDCTYSHSPKSFISPTEAYEAGIEYSLNNLL